MGALKGSVSLTRFRVRGSVPKRFASPYMQAIRLRKFADLSVDGEEEQSSGWCVAGDPLDLQLQQQDVIRHNYIVLGLRVDRWRIPRPLFKAQFESAVQAWRERTGREKINRTDKDELAFRVTRALRKKVLPVMRCFDVCWNVDTGSVLFWSRSPRTKEDFRELFEQTFSLELDEDSPYMSAKALLSEAALEQLTDLEPMSLGSAPKATQETD
jgi:hypothetical protein